MQHAQGQHCFLSLVPRFPSLGSRVPEGLHWGRISTAIFTIMLLSLLLLSVSLPYLPLDSVSFYGLAFCGLLWMSALLCKGASSLLASTSFSCHRIRVSLPNLPVSFSPHCVPLAGIRAFLFGLLPVPPAFSTYLVVFRLVG
jgi:hypothetical protein